MREDDRQLKNVSEFAQSFYGTKPEQSFTQKNLCKDMNMGIPGVKKSKIKNPILKRIATDAHMNESTLSDIINRRVRVERKHLLLMWLLYESGTSDFENKETAFVRQIAKRQSEALNENEKELKKTISRINKALLTPCGMPELDARNTFDWVYLHALHFAYLHSSNKEQDAVERFCEVIDKLFGETK
jgi:AraC-like DNA-binding protein